MGAPPQSGGIPINGVTMLDLSRPSPIWLVWPYLPWLERLFFTALIVLSIYVLFSAATTVTRVRKTRALLHNGNGADAQELFVALRKRSARVDRLITTAFYLFGMLLFLGLQGAYFTIDDSKTPVGWLILRNFESRFVFASNVFFVLLVLHVVGWFTSSCVGKLELQSRPRHVQ
jgi:hypothetical protein